MHARYIPHRPISEVLADARRIYRDGFRRCWPLSLLGAASLSAATHHWSAQLSGLSDTATSLDDLDPSAALRQLESCVTPAALSAGLLLLVVALLVYSALMVRLQAPADAGPGGSLQAFAMALRRLPHAILASVLWTLSLSAGLALFIVPGIYWSGRLQFWLPAMMIDHAGALDSLRSSWALTRHQWWRSNSALTLALIIIGLLALLTDALTSGAAALVAAPLHSSARAVAFSSALFDALADVFLLPMLPAALLAIYDDLKQSQGPSPGSIGG